MPNKSGSRRDLFIYWFRYYSRKEYLYWCQIRVVLVGILTLFIKELFKKGEPLLMPNKSGDLFRKIKCYVFFYNCVTES